MGNDVSTTSTHQRLQRALLDVIGSVPTSPCSASEHPDKVARRLAFRAKATAATVSAGLALPPGPFGMLTILPDLITIWRIQSQLVADIAAVYGKTSVLRPETMLLCLFKHGTASLARDLLTRVGGRVIIRRATLRWMQQLMANIGVRVSQRLLGRTVSRWLPVIGALAVGAYAWYDTDQVATSAIDLFRGEIAVDDQETDAPPA